MGFLGEGFGLWGLRFGISLRGSRSLRVTCKPNEDVQESDVSLPCFGLSSCLVPSTLNHAPVLGGSWDLVAMVISTLILFIRNYKHSYSYPQ